MRTLTGSDILTGIKEYFLMALGMLLYSFGWIACILPSHCMGGGAGGLSLIVYYAIGGVLPVGAIVFIVNAILLLVAGFIVGWRFGIKTIYCIVMMSIFMSLLQKVMPGGVDIFHLENRLLSTILGGLLAGIGVALCFQQGGSTGGTDIVAMIINKYRAISYGKIVMSSDFFIIASALLVS
ncbi:MAG TPA: YitT family protein, partial [Candidatus Alistipes excrementipullorum]|nr:YitT family protein [Candidatus Alistipes excrementipullorum]